MLQDLECVWTSLLRDAEGAAWYFSITSRKP